MEENKSQLQKEFDIKFTEFKLKLGVNFDQIISLIESSKELAEEYGMPFSILEIINAFGVNEEDFIDDEIEFYPKSLGEKWITRSWNSKNEDDCEYITSKINYELAHLITLGYEEKPLGYGLCSFDYQLNIENEFDD